ncbi:MAG: toll/interleukin-1 receptor domain-containing protein [Anaerolineae bacterium]|nr:toll/interleukin-1 receptor domain-containing protein [Anaerolineae bacterium]
MLKIFLSYARADGNPAATRLRTELERANFSIWRDIEDMQGGLGWKEQLRAALREIDVVLVLLTPASAASPYVTWEWENALTLQKRVIPLLISPCEVPSDLKRLHYHNLNQPDNYALGLMALVRDLNNVSAVIEPDIPDEVVPVDPTVNMQGGFYQPNWKVERDVIQAQRDVIIVGRDISQENEALAQVFADLMKNIKLLPADDQAAITPIAEQARTQAEKIQKGDESPETQTALEKRLKNLAAMAPDIGEVIIAALASPAAGIALTIQKIAQKVQEQLKN